MDLLKNPFHILTASPRDNRRRIMELADERSLLVDSSECTEARSELTSPRKRLSAEVAWLPGIGPKRVLDLISLVESNPSRLIEKLNTGGTDSSEPSKELRKWLDDRESALQTKFRFEESGGHMSLRDDVVHPDSLDEPLRSEAIRYLAIHEPSYVKAFGHSSDAKLPPLPRANLLAAGLSRLSDHSADDLAEWIVQISWAFEDIDHENLSVIINEERVVSGFPEVSDLSAVEAEIQERRRYYRQVIKSALDNLSPKDLVETVTLAVESATDYGEEHGPILISDLVDSYEVEAQGFLDKEEANIKALVNRLRDAVDAEKQDSLLDPMVKQLIHVVKNWDTVAQPIQVSTKSRGLDH